jgi:phosphatidylethanolamine-binding protein (PEBP) family uncharacterized protein
MNTTTNTTKIDNASKALEKCSNVKCDNIISKQNLDILGLKHMSEVKGNCNGFSDKECVDKIKKEDKFGYTKMFDARKSCVDKECSKEAIEFDKLLFPSRFKKNITKKNSNQRNSNQRNSNQRNSNQKNSNQKHKSQKSIKRKFKKVSKNVHRKSKIQIGGKGESLSISYNGKSIGNGSNITNNINYSKAPTITIDKADSNKTYLITMTDPDAPNGEDRTTENFTFTHWVFTMINGQINDTFVSYYPPSPPKGSGIHRYQFNLYDISSINTDELKVNNNNNADYYKTILQPFLDKNNNKNKNIEILPITSFQFRVKSSNP